MKTLDVSKARKPRTGASRRFALAVFASLVGLVATPTIAAQCRGDAAPGVDWSECKKRMLMLGNSNLDRANLAGADFSMTDLAGANLNAAVLTKATLVRASLAGAQAAGANFDKAEGYRANLSGIAATGASFVSSELQRANFAGSDLQNVNFTKGELGRAVFDGAKLDNAHFAMANLSRAIFRNARLGGRVDFTHAFLFLTRIEGADLSKASGLTQEQIALACGDEATRLPSGLTVPDGWPCAEE